MTRRRGVLIVAAGLAVVPLLTLIAAASEEAGHHGGGIPVATLLFSTINLLIFVGILARYVFPSVRTWVRDRRTRVIHTLDEAAKAKAEAERLRAQWELRLRQIDQEIAGLQAQAGRDAERERERILEAARKTADAIRRDAERAAAYEVRRAQEQLRAELVRQAVRLAEEATRAQWSPADQQRSVGEFLKRVAP
jgi:F-type H+-transporting ATPase subunit b